MSYETDILTWSEQQADLLRRAARGERVNGLDWDNVIEEVESVGRSELHAVESQLRVALTHLLLIAYPPWPDPMRHWTAEVAAALDNARRRYVPSMGQRIDLDDVWRAAWRVAQTKLQHEGARPRRCPVALAELLAETPDIEGLVARIAGQ